MAILVGPLSMIFSLFPHAGNVGGNIGGTIGGNIGDKIGGNIFPCD